jgi:hypothetical protein
LNGANAQSAQIGQLLLRPAPLQPEFLNQHPQPVASQPKICFEIDALNTSATRQRPDFGTTA